MGVLSEISLLSPVQGIMGEGYGPLSSGVQSTDDFTFYGEQIAHFLSISLYFHHG